MFKPFAPNEIRPTGWLLRQLEIEADGLCGNLDLVWPDVRDSAWIGGDREGWERVPYWLDGFIPLAYLLDREDMKARADKYINAIIDRQCKSGWICPCAESEIPKYDLWAVFLIGKVLTVYHRYTASRRAYNALYRAMKNLWDILSTTDVKLFSWAKFRWFECFIPLKYLYDRKKEDWILDLARTLEDQGAKYSEFAPLWERPLNRWRLDTHIVNICMELKSEAVSRALLGDARNNAEERYKLLKRTNGTVTEIFTGDECLSGVRNNQGTELCAVNELMYSYEWLYYVTGKPVWMDRLEVLAFNALPATFTTDMWAHQYVQSVNQISAYPFPGKSFYRTNNSEAHLFGLEPNYGCCTANAAQAYPKLVTSIFARSRGAIVCNTMLPARLNTKVGGNNVCVAIDTLYPFRNSATYTVECEKETTFALNIRVPAFAKRVLVDGVAVEKKAFISIKRAWVGTSTVTVTFEAEPDLISRPYGLCTARWGNLLFSLPIKYRSVIKEYEKNGVERKHPYCDYHLYPESEWSFGFASDKLVLNLNEGDDIPYSETAPKVTLTADLAKIDWGYADGYDCVANYKPSAKKALSAPVQIELVPYGSAKLRMTEMPKIKD